MREDETNIISEVKLNNQSTLSKEMLTFKKPIT